MWKCHSPFFVFSLLYIYTKAKKNACFWKVWNIFLRQTHLNMIIQEASEDFSTRWLCASQLIFAELREQSGLSEAGVGHDWWSMWPLCFYCVSPDKMPRFVSIRSIWLSCIQSESEHDIEGKRDGKLDRVSPSGEGAEQRDKIQFCFASDRGIFLIQQLSDRCREWVGFVGPNYTIAFSYNLRFFWCRCKRLGGSGKIFAYN